MVAPRPRHLAVSVGVVFVFVSTSGTVAIPAIRHTITHATGHPEAAPVDGQSETAFITAVLKDLGDPVTSANVTSLAGWVQRETPWPPVASNNPWNSSLYEPGSTVYNDLPGGGHVWNYPTAQEGAAANAATISNGWYPHIVADLKAGTGLCGSDATLAVEFLDWSRGPNATSGGYDSPVC